MGFSARRFSKGTRRPQNFSEFLNSFRLLSKPKRYPERRRWVRISLAIPVFVRWMNAQGREFLEFSTLLNAGAGGALLAIRKPLRRFFHVSRHSLPDCAVTKLLV